jgi:hypothetical protein
VQAVVTGQELRGHPPDVGLPGQVADEDLDPVRADRGPDGPALSAGGRTTVQSSPEASITSSIRSSSSIFSRRAAHTAREYSDRSCVSRAPWALTATRRRTPVRRIASTIAVIPSRRR